MTQSKDGVGPGPHQHEAGWSETVQHGVEKIQHGAGSLGRGIELFEQLVEHEIQTIEEEIVEIGSTPPRVLFRHVVYRELPYIAMLSLALLGIGYVSFSGQPVQLFWLMLAPLFGVICTIAGWRVAEDRKDRIRTPLDPGAALVRGRRRNGYRLSSVRPQRRQQ